MMGGMAYRKRGCVDTSGNVVTWVEYQTSRTDESSTYQPESYSSTAGGEMTEMHVCNCDYDFSVGESPIGPSGAPEKKLEPNKPENRCFPKLGIVRPIHAPPGGWGFFKGAWS